MYLSKCVSATASRGGPGRPTMSTGSISFAHPCHPEIVPGVAGQVNIHKEGTGIHRVGPYGEKTVLLGQYLLMLKCSKNTPLHREKLSTCQIKVTKFTVVGCVQLLKSIC